MPAAGDQGSRGAGDAGDPSVAAELLRDVDTAPGAVPQLRLLAAVHELGLEPGRDHQNGFAVTARDRPDAPEVTLARCGDHGPPLLGDGERP
jgi:hypothetical protein